MPQYSVNRYSARRFTWLGAGLALSLMVAGPTSALAQNPFAGIYMGTFSSFCDPDDGQFALLVQGNGDARILSYDRFDEEGDLDTTVVVQQNGTLTGPGIISGSITGSSVSGTYLAFVGCTGSFTGTKTAADGTFPAQAAGFYTGSVIGTVIVQGLQGSFASSGPLHAIVAENGQIMAFASTTANITGQGLTTALSGGFLQAAASGGASRAISGTLLDGTIITGAANTAAFTASGNFSASDPLVTHNGTWSITRTIALPTITVEAPPLKALPWLSLLLAEEAVPVLP